MITKIICVALFLYNSLGLALLEWKQRWSLNCFQRCHSEKMKNPRWANKKPKKTQGQISIHFHTIFGKNRLFPGKSRLFPRKIPFYPPKILTTFF